MATYVILLRGVNVSGRNPLKMKDFAARLESIGLEDVETYLQSGNAVVRGPDRSAEALTIKIKKMLIKHFNIDTDVRVSSGSELTKAVAANPFLKDRPGEIDGLHLTFLSDAPGKEALKKLGELKTGKDRWEIVGKHLFLHCPEGYGETALSNARLEKILGVDATTRNWKTVMALNRIAGERATG
jgi:uncharacterized protein (DUF1697 family)